MFDGPACKRETLALLRNGANANELEQERRATVDMNFLIIFRIELLTCVFYVL
jgi:hypothetical protein